MGHPTHLCLLCLRHGISWYSNLQALKVRHNKNPMHASSQQKKCNQLELRAASNYLHSLESPPFIKTDKSYFVFFSHDQTCYKNDYDEYDNTI